MTEPSALGRARTLLARAEGAYRSPAGLADLERGLDLLEEVIAAGRAPACDVARNVASAYRTKIYQRVESLLAAEPTLPEPDLEHLFRVVLAFDRSSGELPPAARALKVSLVRHLIDRYYEGHPAERKREALEELAKIAGERP